jgi:hypothetical protein
MNLMEIDCVDGRWMELAQDRVQLVGFGINGVEPLCSAIRELVSNIDRPLDAISLPVQLTHS